MLPSAWAPKLIPPFPIDRLFSILYFLSVIIITTHENWERDCKKRKERMKKKGGKKDNSIWFRICFYIRVFPGKKKRRKSMDGIFISLLLAVVFLFIYFFYPQHCQWHFEEKKEGMSRIQNGREKTKGVLYRWISDLYVPNTFT